MTPKEYSKSEKLYLDGIFEDDYPQMDELLSFAKHIVSENDLDKNNIEDLITVLALDNESEELLDFIKANSSYEQLNVIVNIGLSSIQPNARWQIAMLITERKPPKYREMLLVLSKDENEYVAKRAKHCICFLDGNL